MHPNPKPLTNAQCRQSRHTVVAIGQGGRSSSLALEVGTVLGHQAGGDVDQAVPGLPQGSCLLSGNLVEILRMSQPAPTWQLSSCLQSWSSEGGVCYSLQSRWPAPGRRSGTTHALRGGLDILYAGMRSSMIDLICVKLGYISAGIACRFMTRTSTDRS